MDWPATLREVPAQMDELQLIEKAKDGDLAAFEALYRAHVGRVFAASLRLSGDRNRAEEITQDVFVRLWSRIGTFEGKSALSSWLYRLTVNRVLDRLRSERSRELWETQEDEGGWGEVPTGRGSHETRRALESAIQSLPDGARMVFVLHDIEGYRHEEIGQMTGIAVGTSKAQLHRARKLLRNQLGKQLG